MFFGGEGGGSQFEAAFGGGGFPGGARIFTMGPGMGGMG